MNSEAIPEAEDWLQIGTIVAPQGLKGELRVYPNTDFPERFEVPGKRWILHPGETEPQPVELVAGRIIPGKGLYVIELGGVETREQAEALRGCQLLVPESDRPQLGEDEYHVLDLIGLEVFNQLTGESLGKVVDLFAAGNDLLEVEPHRADTAPMATTEIEASPKGNPVKSAKPATILIPFVKAIVPVVDLPAGRIEIVPPPGLLDLNATS